ncbi:glycoside hydrolase family 30 protein [Lepidopterella palustris CBS 459.81]|uniref:Glycoside hydrolase family 30 protein n=1 Tax=Lepidopterella palustris CBS 459.81 TaxID=1314670 RepID=A0A8E2E328_9PEZI|nr:glycoside hydrolase family 30 protein [Lepidopterella palustris CBS 459.81]
MNTTTEMRLKTAKHIVKLANSQLTTAADAVTTIDPTSNGAVWKGLGTSMTWWAKRFDDGDNMANIFSLKWTQYGGNNLPGLGRDIARYNAAHAVGTRSGRGDSGVAQYLTLSAGEGILDGLK